MRPLRKRGLLSFEYVRTTLNIRAGHQTLKSESGDGFGNRANFSSDVVTCGSAWAPAFSKRVAICSIIIRRSSKDGKEPRVNTNDGCQAVAEAEIVCLGLFFASEITEMRLS